MESLPRISSASRLCNGVRDLPFFFPLFFPLWVFPFSSYISEVLGTTVASDNAFLSDPDAADGNTTSAETVVPGLGGARKVVAVEELLLLSSRPGVPLPPLEYASACSSHSLSFWELENDGLPRMEIEERPWWWWYSSRL